MRRLSGPAGRGAGRLIAADDILYIPGDAKNAHLGRLEGASENLRLFKADVLDRDALATAVSGCQGVFHLACPVPTDKVLDPEASAQGYMSNLFSLEKRTYLVAYL